ncbi:MAG: DUF4257 domain-containing protein [Bacteroidota bacterium]
MRYLSVFIVILALLALAPVHAQNSDTLVQRSPAGDTTVSSDTTETRPEAVRDAAAPVAIASVAAQSPFDVEKGWELFAVLSLVFALGAFGGFVTDLATDGGKLSRRSETDSTITVGYVANVIVGGAAALVVLTLNAPETWLALVGTAIVSGISGEAIILAVKASRDAQAERDRARHTRQQSEDRMQTIERSVKQARAALPTGAEVQLFQKGSAAPSDGVSAAAAHLDAALGEAEAYLHSLRETRQAELSDATPS